MLHPSTIIEDNVTIFHQVTCGRGDMYNIFPNAPKSEFQRIILKKGACLCAGAKIICNRGTLVVGENTIIGANAVLTKRRVIMRFGPAFLQKWLRSTVFHIKENTSIILMMR